jgi:hypothetical protein
MAADVRARCRPERQEPNSYRRQRLLGDLWAEPFLISQDQC